MPHSPADGDARPRRLLLLGAASVGFGLLVLLVALADGRALLQTVRGAPPAMLAAPMALTLLSYGAMARSYQGIADAAGSRLSFRTWLRLTFVSNTANYVVTSAGLSGFAVRMFLLAQQGVPSGRAVLISLVQTFLTNVTLLCFILAGFVSLVSRRELTGAPLVAATAVVVAFGALLVLAGVLVAHRPLRRRLLRRGTHLVYGLLRRVAPRRAPRRARLWRFQHNLDEGIEFLLRRKDRMLAPAAWITLDWFLTLAILWVAFRAVGQPIGIGLVLVGFGVGLLLSLVSFVPGGLGIMEGSMAAVYVSLGVPLERAVVAVLIFRVAYYVLPLLVSVFLFHGLMRQVTRRAAEAARV
ncbi:MAG TPA: flippase-like domain-containing protein [Candidatus Binatia bacterium]|nr:flippase-like domain-containing protein [Candidatus Binatia bacterium]